MKADGIEAGKRDLPRDQQVILKLLARELNRIRQEETMLKLNLDEIGERIEILIIENKFLTKELREFGTANGFDVSDLPLEQDATRAGGR